MSDATSQLAPPATYFPPDRGRYDVKPGLFPLIKDFGNGNADRQQFQFDNQFSRYRATKLRVRAADISEYVQTSLLPRHINCRIARHIIDRLTAEHPAFFTSENDDQRVVVACKLTGETIILDRELSVVRVETKTGLHGPSRYDNALDALASQLQEDVAIITSDEEGERLTAIHLCFPNHWTAKQKIGNSFAAAHRPVAGITPITARSDEFVNLMIGATKGLVRFAWGITFDDRLDLHPAESSHHAKFDPQRPRAFLRVERQTMWGFPDVKSSLFTIRTYISDVSALRGTARGRLLAEALSTMPRESRRYKGLETSADILAALLH